MAEVDVDVAEGNSTAVILLQKKQRVLAMLKHLNSETLRPNIADDSVQTQTLALALDKDIINTQVNQLQDVSNVLNSINQELVFQKQLDEYLSQLFTSISAMDVGDTETNLNKAHQLLSRINNLKQKSRTLSSYIKLVVNKYLFDKEFVHMFNRLDADALKSRKQRFLKLLETLLNNNILNSSGEQKFINLESLDDPLVRFLIVNRIVEVLPPNKIILKDLTFGL